MPVDGADETPADVGKTTRGGVDGTGAVEGGAFAGWVAAGVGAPMPPPPPATGLSAGPFEGRAEGTLAEAIVIGLAYRPTSTVTAGAAWGIAIGEVVATTVPKPPPPARLIASGATLGEAAGDEGIGTNLVG